MKEIVAQFNMVGFTPEQYAQVTKDLEAAGKANYSGRLFHIAAQQTDGLLITDVWESKEALDRFSEELIPILIKNGVTPNQPTILPLLNMFEKDAYNATINHSDFVL